MSLYYETLYAWKCKGTHHKLAMEALPLLSCEDSDDWSQLFLQHIESYLTGSKDPDKKFKDFRNHVLHVGDNYWGGAVKATQEWYHQALEAFSEGKWRQGVYATGVMSHYLTDVFCPLHTGQSEKENTIHRACEWSISCSYDALLNLLTQELGGFPEIKLSTDENWLEQLIHSEASHAHFLYHTLVDGYQFDLGVQDPPAGLNETLSKEMAMTLGRASVALALVIDRCLKESQQKPPRVSLMLPALLSQITIPIFWVTQKMASAADRREVLRIYQELQNTGKVEKTLPEENRVLRDLIRQEQGGEQDLLEQVTSASARGKLSEANTASAEDPFREEAEAELNSGSSRKSDSAAANKGARSSGGLKFYLQPESALVDAPSIGPKTASRFQKIGIKVVSEFLEADPQQMAQELKTRWITADLIQAWQQQASLMCSVPGLRGHDAQLLQGVGVENAQDLAYASPDDLLSLVLEFAQSTEGQGVLRGGAMPDFAEVSQWIRNAQSTQQRAA